MAAATVTVTNNAVGSAPRISNQVNASFIPITVTYSATSYATATGGLPFDIFSALANFGPQQINYKDVVGLIANTTTEKFVVASDTFAIGTVTSSTCPCTVRLYGTGSANKAALTEVDDAALTGSFEAYLVVARNGVN